MKNRTYICSHCGEIKRHHDEGLGVISSMKHCGAAMGPLTHEQAYVATHLEKGERLPWYAKGANILKGSSKRKRWIAAIQDDDIEEAKIQKSTHRPKKTENYLDQVLKTYYKFAEPYIKQNMELLIFLESKNASRYVAHILFISVRAFRMDIYQHIAEYNLNNEPKKYLRLLVKFLMSLVEVYDKTIEKELMELWISKNLISRWELELFDGPCFPHNEDKSRFFKLRDYAIKCGVNINQTAAPDEDLGT